MVAWASAAGSAVPSGGVKAGARRVSGEELALKIGNETARSYEFAAANSDAGHVEK
jgi:hypothetical protein